MAQTGEFQPYRPSYLLEIVFMLYSVNEGVAEKRSL